MIVVSGKHRVSKQKDVVDRRRQMEGMGAYYGFILLVGIVVRSLCTALLLVGIVVRSLCTALLLHFFCISFA